MHWGSVERRYRRHYCVQSVDSLVIAVTLGQSLDQLFSAVSLIFQAWTVYCTVVQQSTIVYVLILPFDRIIYERMRRLHPFLSIQDQDAWLHIAVVTVVYIGMISLVAS